MSVPITKKSDESGGEGGWALTLADMMTLLLCFFVLMLAISKVDEQRYEVVSENLSEAMGGKVESKYAAGGEGSLTHQVKFKVEPQKQNLFALQLELAREVGSERDAVSMRLRPDGVAINLKGGVFFPSGEADLTPTASRILKKIIPSLKKAGYQLTIEGHTDNIPIRSAKFPSNWELSSARAAAVARYFIDHGYEAKDLKVMGLADTRPEAPNTDSQGRPLRANQAKNRRVTILVHPLHMKAADDPLTLR